ncbi:unnamed protein product [Bursaphelenchus xylophilus]|uniref:acid phosphatase n=1 Tax=Bursaphelenchus xylophilus TaxID=6326 RepID=A0A1I7SUV4_BURXY|nr:unnamed protein product [Bursaphelenchus xylophilus]CAG9125855.1 unnamed protein product [Bursaphelenchus xylophilus]
MAKDLIIVGFFLFFLSLLSVFGDDHGEDELIFVSAIWRHGERSIHRDFPFNLYNATFWPNGINQLTERGIQQQRELGKFLRSRYMEDIHFFPKSYSNTSFQIESTMTNRTQQSALHNLQGLFNNHSLSMAHVHIYHPRLEDQNIIGYPYFGSCEYADQLCKYLYKTPAVQEFVQNRWFQLLSPNFDDIRYLFDFADPPYVEKRNFGLELSSLYEDHWDEIFDSYVQSFKHFYGDGIHDPKISEIRHKLLQYNIGRIITELSEIFKLKTVCTEHTRSSVPDCEAINSLKFKGYSMHDTYVLAALQALGFHKLDYNRDDNAEMSACLIYELWRESVTSNTYVKVFYRRSKDFFYHITPEINGCSRRGCSVERILELFAPFVIEDAEEYCAQPLF